MLNNMNNEALGIIFPNSYDTLLPELTNDRSMASIPFASRYRLVDFVLSSMVNGGIDNVSILAKENYLSLIDHLGNGREWDLSRKNGGLNIVPPFAQKSSDKYNGRVEALSSIYNFLNREREKYVVMSDSNIAMNFDFKAFLNAHIKSGADVTMVYAKTVLPDSGKKFSISNKDLYYTLVMDDDKRVTEIKTSPETKDEVKLSLNMFVIERELLIKLISQAYVDGMIYFERDVLARHLESLTVKGYEFDGYFARMVSMKSYFDENMKLLEQKNLDALFSGNPIYTKIRDDNPARYVKGAKVSNVMVADGCVIEGEVENSILFRGVHVKKGAKVSNCILLQDTVVGENASINYLVTDKIVNIKDGTTASGTVDFPVYVAKGKEL